MSIKIYNGFRSAVSEPDVFNFAARIRDIVEPIFVKKLNHYATLLHRDELDWSNEILFPNKQISAIWENNLNSRNVRIVYDVIDALRRQAERSFSEMDFGYEIALIPNMLDSNRPLLAIFSECQDYQEALRREGLIEDYAYYNNVEPELEGESPAEFKRRKKAWGALVDSYNGRDTPASVGLMIPQISCIDSVVALRDLDQTKNEN